MKTGVGMMDCKKLSLWWWWYDIEKSFVKRKEGNVKAAKGSYQGWRFELLFVLDDVDTAATWSCSELTCWQNAESGRR